MTSIEGHIQIELLQGSLSSLGNAPLRLYLSVTLASLMMTMKIIIMMLMLMMMMMMVMMIMMTTEEC